ncbi:unnamed protein product [Schistosoma rodhaini]|uniref:Mitochondrial cytochrome c oxidase subunit VIc/VIIs domain-containing protein n=1 Tax=Schistosoma rodhaini TaxID=6188 RepID=A0AA85EKR0_9TREM|nr:unnamed protein product [Schistosoma rodhaini]
MNDFYPYDKRQVSDLELASLFRRERFATINTMDPAKLRNFRVGRALRAMGIATVVSTVVTGVVVHMYTKKEISTIRKFYHSYDPQLEWNVLLNSGILKTVNKDGSLVDLED